MTEQPIENAITVEHTGDNTLVHGTTRDDKDAIVALKAAGFKWSRNLDAWYLPRTWGIATRDQRVRQLELALGDTITVERGERTKSGTVDERIEAKIERGHARADRLEARAEHHDADYDAFHARSAAITDSIPFGQPILVGHHSERRHRNDIDKSWNLLGKAVEASKLSDQDNRSAATARHNAENYDAPLKVSRRLARNEAEHRRLVKILTGSGKEMYGHSKPATGEYAERLTAMITDLAAVIERDKRVQAESGVQTFTKATVKAGDTVTIRGRQDLVVKANPTTVQVKTSFGMKLTYPWSEVTAHQPKEITE